LADSFGVEPIGVGGEIWGGVEAGGVMLGRRTSLESIATLSFFINVGGLMLGDGICGVFGVLIDGLFGVDFLDSSSTVPTSFKQTIHINDKTYKT